MSPISIRHPGDVVNEVYSQNMKSLTQMCYDAGDDPTSIINEVKYELQVYRTFIRAFVLRLYHMCYF